MPVTPTLLLRRELDPVSLLRDHPPLFRHPHKRLAFELACPPGAEHRGPIVVTRWRGEGLPERSEPHDIELTASPSPYDYDAEALGVWHVNFADPRLFAAYGSGLLAQDELQALEHPLLGSIREALLAEDHALTEDAAGATPVLIAGVERRCTLDTTADALAGRPYGLCGGRFATASASALRAALRVHAAPTRTNLIAMSAPRGGRGQYFRADLERIAATAYAGLAAAVAESATGWPGCDVEVRTGFWGCGAFGGHRVVMTALQILAARWAGVSRLRFYTVDRSGLEHFRRGAADAEAILDAGCPGEPLVDVLERLADLDYEWGESDGT